jgi:hypothetical protein
VLIAERPWPTKAKPLMAMPAASVYLHESAKRMALRPRTILIGGASDPRNGSDAMVLQISYDLIGDQPADVYKNLEDAILAYGTWLHFQKSEWLIDTADSPMAVAKGLRAHMRGADRLLVIRVTNDWYGWMTDEQLEWMGNRTF